MVYHFLLDLCLSESLNPYAMTLVHFSLSLSPQVSLFLPPRNTVWKYSLPKMSLLTVMEHTFLHDKNLYLMFRIQVWDSNDPFPRKQKKQKTKKTSTDLFIGSASEQISEQISQKHLSFHPSDDYKFRYVLVI